VKSVFQFLLSWGISFAVLWYGAHQLFYPPGDWIGAALVSFFFALGVGGLIKARLERRDAALAARPEGPPRDGERVAIAGTIEPTGEPLRAPLSGKACVAYDYSISHIPERSVLIDGQSKNQSSRPSPVVDRSGMALAPSVIRSNLREVRLLAFPGFERFPDSKLDADKIERARAYIAATPFTDQSLLNTVGQVAKVLEDRSGSLRVDWKMTSHEDLEDSRFEERVVPVGAKACVVGLYSAKDNAIVPQANVGGVRLIQGTREEALQFLRDKGGSSLIAAALFIALPGPIAYGVLSYRESYDFAHDRPSVQGDRMAKVGPVRATIRRADPNARDAHGDPLLLNAADAKEAAALIDAGANVDATGGNGATAIMMASAYGRADVVRLLIAKHANVNSKAHDDGRTALDYALQTGNKEIEEMLRNAGAQPTAPK